MLRNLLLATLFMWTARGINRSQCVPPEWFPKTETFSAIADIQGQGPAGSELQLEEQGKRVAATLRDYRGKAIPVATKLQGSIEESKPVGGGPTTCKVRLSGKDNRVPVEVEGEITPVYFKGILTRHMGPHGQGGFLLPLVAETTSFQRGKQSRDSAIRFRAKCSKPRSPSKIAKIGTDSVSRMVWMPL
jgi:hypothetical protein